MARFQRNYGTSFGIPDTGESAAYSRLSQQLSGFSRQMGTIQRRESITRGTREGAEADVSKEAPELRDTFRASSQAYNETVLKGHYAAIENFYTAEIKTAEAKFKLNPEAYTARVDVLRKEMMNEVAPEVKGVAARTFDKLASHHLSNITTPMMVDAVKASGMAQAENLANASATAMQYMKDDDMAGFAESEVIFKEKLAAASHLQDTEKMAAAIAFQREAIYTMNMTELDGFIKSNDYDGAADHIEAVRSGKLALPYTNTGLTSDQVADYMTARMKKTGEDFEAAMKLASVERSELERVENETIEAIKKDGYDLLATPGGITNEWLETNRDILPDDDYKYFQQRLLAGGGLSDGAANNPDAYLDLLDRIDAGESVMEDAETDMRTGQISKPWYDAVKGRQEEFKFGDADKYMSGTLKVAETVDDPGRRARMASAHLEWAEWKRLNPDASRQDAFDQAGRIAKSALLVYVEQLSQLAPLDLVGTRNSPDIEATKDALIGRMYEKHGDDEPAIMKDPEFVQQMQRIKQLEATTTIRNQAAE